MNKKNDSQLSETWFYKWVLNNQALSIMLVVLVFLLTILVFTKVSFLFRPIFSFLTILMLPLVISTILYYLTKPSVDLIENLGPNRTTSIFIVFGLIICILIWAFSGLIPMISNQMTTFLKDLPKYVGTVNQEANKFLENKWLVSYQAELQDMLTNITNKALDYAQTFSKHAIDWAGNFAGAIARITISIIISPFILFYFLRDSGKNEGWNCRNFTDSTKKTNCACIGGHKQTIIWLRARTSDRRYYCWYYV
ncbi:membrane protein [Streptococcus parauberis KCTC 11537]|nr:membrane protein [Streptococcus parauberis KCTC 11537]